MSYHPCVSGCGRFLSPQDGHDRCLTCLGIQHAEGAFVDGSCSSCGDMTISELRDRLRYVKLGGVPLPLPRSGVRPGTRGAAASGGVRGDLRITVRASPRGVPHPSSAPQPVGLPLERAGTSAERGTPPVSFGAPPDDQMSIAASEGELSLSGDDDSAALPPSGVVALSEPDPEMTAMLSRAAENVGLVWNPPPRPDPSRLDEWFLGGGRAGSQRPPPVPFFPEVHEELTRSWKAPFTARNKSCGSSALTTLDGGAALGYTGIPSVERSVAMQLCPTAATTLRGDPCLPSRACKYSSGLTGSAYRACGEAASALHAMALLQVHQAKALKDLHEGGHDLTVLHELRAATDLALRATKVTAQSLGRAMSTLVVQERHLWLCLADMKEQEKVQFLNAPVSQTGLFGDAVESFAQQFSAAQKQTEAIKHIMRRRKPAASTPAAVPQPARRRGRPSAAAPAPAQPQQPSTRQRRGAGRRQDAQPVQAPAKPGGKRRCKRPWDGRPGDGGDCSVGDGDCATPSPGGGPGGESFVSFCFCSAAGPAASGTQNINKRAVSSISGSQEEESGEPCITSSLPSSSLARQQVVAQEHPSCPFVEPGKGGSTPVPASSRHTPGCHKPQAGFLCFLPHEEESGECYTTHPDPAPCHHRPGRHRPRGGSLCSTMLPLRGYVGGPVGSAGTVSRSLVSAPRSVSVAPADHQTRLRDSVRPASPQVQGCPLHFSESCRCPCPVCGNRSPAGEGCDRTGPSSRYEVGVLQPLLHCAQEKRWVTTDLGSASFEPCTSQAAVQNVDAETHFRVRPSPRLVCSDRPEGCVLSCLDPPATQAIPAIRVRGSGISVQGPALRAVPVASCLHQSRGGGPCSPERTRGAHPQLPRRLAHTCTVSRAVARTQGPGAQAPQPVGPSGQLGKEQTRANTEDLFSRHGVGFGQPDSTPHPGTCSVGAELPQDFIRQDGGPTETLSEAPGAYGCSCGDSAARSAPYETASALAPWPNPEVGVGTRYSPGSDYTGLPQNLQPVVRSLVPSGRSAPGAGIQACGGIHGCLGHWLGSHVQRARSVRGLDGSPTALAYQLPRAAGSTPGLEPPQRAPSGQGRSGPYGQHCDRCVYQPARRFTLPSHVATRPPPPPLESEASEVPSCHPHPRSAQPGSRRAVSSSTSRGVETPSSGGPADLESVRSCSGRPVCISGNHPLPVVLLPNRGNARHGCTGTQLAPGPAQICVPPSEPTSTDTVQDQGGRGAGLVSSSILAQQDLVPGTHAPRDSPSLADSSEEGFAFSETGHPPAPASRLVETPCVVPGRDAEVLGDLPQEVALTIASARAPSTRRAYALKWNLFVEWCSSHREDPRRCSIRAVLSFLQQGLERRLSPSTLKVYVAAISAHHDPVEGRSVGKHDLVIRFLRGARRLNPPRPPSLPSWDLALVLRALQIAPFEPLQSVELKFLSMKTLLLTALASIKRVGDLQAFSVDESCLEFGPADSSATLRPGLAMCPRFLPLPSGTRWWTCKRCPWRRQTQPWLRSVLYVHCDSTWIELGASGPQNSSLFVTEGSRRGMLSPSRGWPTG